MQRPPLGRAFLGEAVGTFLLVFFGCGVVHAAVLMGAHKGLWQVAIVWGVAIMLATYVVGALSGAHINPAITLTMFLWRRFPGALVLPYVLSQLAGAMLAAASLFILFGPFLAERERSLGVVRGGPGSEMTAMCYGEFYPNPGGMEEAWRKPEGRSKAEILREHYSLVPEGTAFFAEFLGTLILALVVFAVTDERNCAAPEAKLGPVFIGLTVAALISVLDPLTQACFNPARDFGPRLFSFLAGWGEAALPGPNGRGFLTVYIVAPLAGAAAGGGLYSLFLGTKGPPTEVRT